MLNVTYNSKLKNINPMQKVLFSLITMLLCLFASSNLLSLFIIVVAAYVVLVKGQTSPFTYLKLMLLPASFILLSTASIILNFSSSAEIFIWKISLFGSFMGVTNAGIYSAVNLFLKSFACVSCMYMISLTTPMTDFLNVLKRLKCPKILIELMSLIYRFIFVLLDTASSIRTAQKARLGYVDMKTSFYSTGKLFSSLFVRSMKRADDIYNALESRCYDDEINVLSDEGYVNINPLKPILFFIFLTIIFIVDKIFLHGVM